MSNERDILKNLLLKEELELLNQLKEKLLSEEQFTAEVANVLAAAVKRSQENNDNLQVALAEPIKAGVENTFTENKESIIDSLLPIMGQLIRKTVANSIKQFVADINRTIEEGYSIKALKWRWQAKKAGITYPEMLFQKTIRYQVTELFLISSENGLLIEHVGVDDLLKDNNAISAMLTVIQDFISDSFNEDGASLQSVVIKNVEYIFALGPNSLLATVVKGSPTERLKEKSQQLIENIHAKFSGFLTQEESYRNIPKLKSYLRSHLVTKNISESVKKINWIPWILGLILIVSALIYWPYKRNQEMREVIDKVQSIDGFYLKSVKRTSKGFIIDGLLDPVADISHIQSNTIKFSTKPYLSLDNSIINKRISKVVSEYKGINATLSNGLLRLSGSISKDESASLLLKLNKIIGVASIDNQVLIDQSDQIQKFLQDNKNLIPEVNSEILNDGLLLIGNANYNDYQTFKSDFNFNFSNIKIDDSKVTIVNSTVVLIQQINSNKIIVPSKEQGNNSEQLSDLIGKIKSILARNHKIQINLLGSSDCNGKLSDSFSQKRANKIEEVFIQKGIEKDIISTKIISCTSFQAEKDVSKQNVLIEVTQQ